MLYDDVLPIHSLTCCLFTEYVLCLPSGILEDTAVHDTLTIKASASTTASPLALAGNTAATINKAYRDITRQNLLRLTTSYQGATVLKK